MSRSKNEILQLRQSLDKAGESSDSVGNFILKILLESNYHQIESIIDILRVLNDTVVTADIIKTTKIALSVNSIKKKYAHNSEVSALAKSIIQNWKDVYLNSQKGADNGTAVAEQEQPASRPTPPLEKNSSDDLDELVAPYAEGRKKVYIQQSLFRT